MSKAWRAVVQRSGAPRLLKTVHVLGGACAPAGLEQRPGGRGVFAQQHGGRPRRFLGHAPQAAVPDGPRGAWRSAGGGCGADTQVRHMPQSLPGLCGCCACRASQAACVQGPLERTRVVHVCSGKQPGTFTSSKNPLRRHPLPPMHSAARPAQSAVHSPLPFLSSFFLDKDL